MPQITFRAMGCQMLALVEAGTPEAAEALNNAPVWFEIWEQCLSRFRPDSELNRLNARAGEWVTVSATLWGVIETAVQAARGTGGLVTPTVLSAMQAIGYVAPFDQMRSAIVEMTVAAPLPTTRPDAWQRIELDADRRAVRLPPDGQIDLGGIAKGWCADQAARRLAVYGPALVDAGGDIAVAPARDQRVEFPIGIAAPVSIAEAPEKLIGIVELAEGGVATSGRDYRRWQLGARQMHHLIDPRTGQPAETDVASATAIASTAARAEAVAKAVLLLGSQAGLVWAESQPDCAVLLVREDGAVAHTINFPLQHAETLSQP